MSEKHALMPRHTVSMAMRYGQPSIRGKVAELIDDGVDHITVLAPAFTADCLETLEELDRLNREAFLEAGGTTFEYIPALNDDDAFAAAIAHLANMTMAGTPVGAPATP